MKTTIFGLLAAAGKGMSMYFTGTVQNIGHVIEIVGIAGLGYTSADNNKNAPPAASK